jgi:hypothetical protein
LIPDFVAYAKGKPFENTVKEHLNHLEETI